MLHGERQPARLDKQESKDGMCWALLTAVRLVLFLLSEGASVVGTTEDRESREERHKRRSLLCVHPKMLQKPASSLRRMLHSVIRNRGS